MIPCTSRELKEIVSNLNESNDGVPKSNITIIINFPSPLQPGTGGSWCWSVDLIKLFAVIIAICIQ